MSDLQEQTALNESPVPPDSPLPPRRVRVRQVDSGAFGTLQSLLGTITIAVFVITFIIQAFTIPSESMEKTLLIGDYLLVDKAHFASGWAGAFLPYEPIQHQDIIVFRYPIHPSMYFVKRVIGLPGDRVRLIDKHVYVNGHAIDEPYVVFSKPFEPYRDNFPNGPWWTFDMDAHWGIQMHKLIENKQLIVPEDCYFVMGDNRDDSSDSRYWGFVPRENIVGRPLLIYFSLASGPLPPADANLSDKLLSLVSRAGTALQHIRWTRVLRLVQ